MRDEREIKEKLKELEHITSCNDCIKGCPIGLEYEDNSHCRIIWGIKILDYVLGKTNDF